MKLLGPTVYVEMHLQENTVFELELGIKVIQNIAQHPLHHVTEVPSMFYVATFKSLRVDAFTRQYII